MGDPQPNHSEFSPLTAVVCSHFEASVCQTLVGISSILSVQATAAATRIVIYIFVGSKDVDIFISTHF